MSSPKYVRPRWTKPILWSLTVSTPQVAIGGVNAAVTFSGAAPGFVGVYQVNVQVPAESPKGNAVLAALTIKWSVIEQRHRGHPIA